MEKFKVFHRTWWRKNPSWPKGLEPCAGKKKYIGIALSENDARRICKQWNSEHEAGKLSDKAEYEKK